jgi:hypothetical protein
MLVFFRKTYARRLSCACCGAAVPDTARWTPFCSTNCLGFFATAAYNDGFRMRNPNPTVDRIREADAALRAKLAKTRG